MIYLTFGDKYSGIYQSQVIDVLKFVNDELGVKSKLIACVPYTIFRSERRIINSNYNNAIVLPMIPSRNHWLFFHSLIIIALGFVALVKSTQIVCRNTWSARIGLFLKKIGLINWVCYDGRGASYAEWEEYLGQNVSINLEKIREAERQAVINSDYRIGVSEKLISYWNIYYNYDISNNKHVVIPCAIAKSFEFFISDKDRNKKRLELGFKKDEIIIAFSGGVDKWQSPELIAKVMENIIENNTKVSFLFLTKKETLNHPAIKPFESYITNMWVKPDEVNIILSIADFALLIRESSITNQVAAPTKFAEYLASGLEVIITNEVGDYSNFVEKNNCGIIYNEEKLILEKRNSRESLHELCIHNFSKHTFLEKYKLIYS
jgi:hypothetical protein